MSRTVAFGIVGGYGATGRVVVSEVWKSCEGKIRQSGRKRKSLISPASNARGYGQEEGASPYPRSKEFSAQPATLNCHLIPWEQSSPALAGRKRKL